MKSDHTHDPDYRSWVSGATGHKTFPLQNLPMGVLDEGGGRMIVAIGDYVLDVQAALDLGYLSVLDHTAHTALRSSRLNGWMQLDAPARLQIRRALFELLKQGSPAQRHQQQILRERNDSLMRLPADIGDYID